MSKVRASALLAAHEFEVDPLTVWVRVAPRWLKVFWREPYTACALPWGVYVRHDIADYEAEELQRILCHELAHIAQWRQLGVGRFIVIYITEYRRNRRAGMDALTAYSAISLEVSARNAEGA